MDPRLENAIMNWFLVLHMVCDTKGQELAREFIQNEIIPQTAIFLDTQTQNNKAKKRRASEIEPSCMEPPTKRRKIDRRFVTAYSNCIWQVNKELFAISVPLEKIIDQCKRVAKGFQEVMRWEESLFQGVIPWPSDREEKPRLTSIPNRSSREK